MATTKKKQGKDWTVIGLYVDNDQIWASPATGSTPKEAARNAALAMLKTNEWDLDQLGDILIVEVIPGTHKLVFGAETPTPADQL